MFLPTLAQHQRRQEGGRHYCEQHPYQRLDREIHLCQVQVQPQDQLLQRLGVIVTGPLDEEVR